MIHKNYNRKKRNKRKKVTVPYSPFILVKSTKILQQITQTNQIYRIN